MRRTPGVLAQAGMKSGAAPLVTVQLPSPTDAATGMVDQPGVCRTRARSVSPFWVKSPAITRTPGALAQEVMKSATGPLVTVQLPSPTATATGIDDQPGVCRTRARSVSPFPLKSPAITRTPGALAQEVMKSATGPFVTFQ